MAKNGRIEKLKPQEAKFISYLSKGYKKGESAQLAGYSPHSASTIASQLLKRTKIIKALDNAGLTAKGIAEGIKTNTEAGMGVKATASDSLKGLALASQLKGYLDKEVSPQHLEQTNIYIRELKNMNNKQLNAKIDTLQEDIKTLK